MMQTAYSRLRRNANRIAAKLVPAYEVGKHVAVVDSIVEAAKVYYERLQRERNK